MPQSCCESPDLAVSVPPADNIRVWSRAGKASCLSGWILPMVVLDVLFMFVSSLCSWV